MNYESIFAGIQKGLGIIGIGTIMVFAFIFILCILAFSRVISNSGRDGNFARLTVPAVVLEKRTRYSRNRNTMRNAVYYVTFEVDSGDRMVLNLSERDFGLLIEGDKGMLTFQGSKFCGFERRC